LSNLSFYLNLTGVPGRVVLPVALLLILLGILDLIDTITPQLNYTPWIYDYILGAIGFITLTLVEYAILNFCSTR